MREPPGSTLSDHGVEDGEQLPHARHQSDLLGLARGYEPSVELLYGGGVSGGNQSRHVECLPDPRSSAPHAAASPQSAGVAVDGSHSDEGGEFPGRKGAKFGQLRQERTAEYRTDSRHATKQRLALFEGGAIGDGFVEVLIYPGKFFFEPPYVSFKAGANLPGGSGAEAVFLGRHHLDELPPTSHDRLKFEGFGFRRSLRLWPDGLGETGEDRPPPRRSWKRKALPPVDVGGRRWPQGPPG